MNDTDTRKTHLMSYVGCDDRLVDRALAGEWPDQEGRRFAMADADGDVVADAYVTDGRLEVVQRAWVTYRAEGVAETRYLGSCGTAVLARSLVAHKAGEVVA